MATKRKQVGFYADEDVELFLRKLDPGVKTKAINDALRTLAETHLTADDIRHMRNRLVHLENNHIAIGNKLFQLIKDKSQGNHATELELITALIELLRFENTGLLLGPEDYAMYRCLSVEEALALQVALDHAHAETSSLAAKYTQLQHREYASHYLKLAGDFERLRVAIRMSRRIKYGSVDAALLVEALFATIHSGNSEGNLLELMKLLHGELSAPIQVGDEEND